MPLESGRRFQQLKDELPVILRLNPRRADADADLSGGQLLRLHLFQRLRVHRELRVHLGGDTRLLQLLPDVAGKVLVGGLPSLVPIHALAVNIERARCRVLEDHAL